jgi:hypothetical protein
MTQFIDWDSLDIPDYETPEEARLRLSMLTDKILAENAISKEPGKNSPGFRPSAEQARQVATMACLGLEQKDIAIVLNIEQSLLKMYYYRELSVSVAVANAQVARQALAMATSGRHPDMTKFWLKSRAKWKDNPEVIVEPKTISDRDTTTAKERLSQLLQAKANARKKPVE